MTKGRVLVSVATVCLPHLAAESASAQVAGQDAQPTADTPAGPLR